MNERFKNWRASLAIGAIFGATFAAGAVTGAVGSISLSRHLFLSQPKIKEIALHRRERLQERLGLTPAQVAKIDPILADMTAKLEAVHREAFNRITRISEESNSRIAAELNEDQKKKFEEMGSEHHERTRHQRQSIQGTPTPASGVQ